VKQLSLLDLLRVWAALTGLVLIVLFFGRLWLGLGGSPLLPMLVSAIGGFELFLYSQELWQKRRGRHG
jgi:hypothetical protein